MYKFTLKTTAVIIAVLVLFYGAYHIGRYLFGSTSSIRLDQTSIIKEIRTLGRLETASFTFEKIIEGGQKGNFFENILYGDRILLIAHADIIAGFDLQKMTDEDIVISGTTLTINLPAPEILVAKLDNEKTRVYDRREGLLSRDGKDLESRARLEAERAIRQDACKADILEIASENGRKQLRTMFSAAGFTEVKVYIPQTICE
jgi:hypothetical protein